MALAHCSERSTLSDQTALKDLVDDLDQIGGMDVPARSLVVCTTHNADTRSLKQILLLTAPLTSVHREVPSG